MLNASGARIPQRHEQIGRKLASDIIATAIRPRPNIHVTRRKVASQSELSLFAPWWSSKESTGYTSLDGTSSIGTRNQAPAFGAGLFRAALLGDASNGCRRIDNYTEYLWAG